MEPQRVIIIWRNLFPPAPATARTDPPAAKLFLSMLCGVPTQILAPINKVYVQILPHLAPYWMCQTNFKQPIKDFENGVIVKIYNS